MTKRLFAPALITVMFGCAGAYAADGSVDISSVTPKDIYSKDQITLNYAATPGSTGDHLHLNVDGKRVDVIRPLKGSTTFGPLSAGTHHVCLAVNTKNHVPTGVEKCVDLTVWQ